VVLVSQIRSHEAYSQRQRQRRDEICRISGDRAETAHLEPRPANEWKPRVNHTVCYALMNDELRQDLLRSGTLKSIKPPVVA
jgi:hypothetical protein